MKACSTKRAAKAAVGEEGLMMKACSTKWAAKAADGEEGSMMKACSTKRKAKAVGEEGPMMKACSTKRKAKAAVDEEGLSKGCASEWKLEEEEEEEEAAAAVALSSGVSEGGKHADSVEAVGGLAPAGNGMWIMPDKEVQFILSRERDQIAPYLRDSFLRQQAYVRSQYEANNGVVLLDERRAMLRAENRKVVLEDFAGYLDGLDLSGGIPISQWKFSDRDSDFFESDEEEDDEEGEVVQGPKTN